LAIAKAQIKKAGLFYFVFLMFSYTTGGPFGMEEMVTTSGQGLTLLYILLIPLFWNHERSGADVAVYPADSAVLECSGIACHG